MTTSDDDPRLDRTLRDVSEAGYDLALALKTALLECGTTPDAPVMLHACCWLLADMITQAAAQRAAPIEQSMTLVVLQITDAVARLTLANAEADAADAVTH